MSSECIQKWLEAREKLEEYTRRVEKYRRLIEESMLSHNQSELSHVTPDGERLCLRLSSQTRESLSKRDVPADVWATYSKATRFRTLRVAKARSAEDD